MKKYGLCWLWMIPVCLWGQGPLSLEDCRKLALEHSQGLNMARQEVHAATDLKKSAYTQFLPSVNFTGSYTRLNKDFQLLSEDIFLPVVPYSAIDFATGTLNEAAFTDASIAASTLVIDPATYQPVTDAEGNYVFQQYAYLPADEATVSLKNIYLANASVLQPVYLGGKIRQGYRIAEETEGIAAENLALKEDEILYKVEQAYWTVVSLKEKLRLAECYAEMLNTLVGDLNNLYSEGIIIENDLMKAELKKKQVEMNRLKASNGLELSKMALCQIMGVEYGGGMEVSDSTLTDPQGPELSVRRDILNRPELNILDHGIQIAESNMKLMKSRFLPNIALTGGYNIMNPNPYKGFTSDFGGDWYLELACTVPIYHFGDRRHTLGAAKAAMKVSELKRSETEELISLEVQKALFQYKESEKKKNLAEDMLAQAEKNLKTVKDCFREGMLKTSDLLEAQALWQEAYSNLIESKTEWQLSYRYFLKATGQY